MLKRIRHLSIVFVLLAALGACANLSFYHNNFMRGQIVAVTSSNVVVCIGSYDNELIGKTLSVYQIEPDVSTLDWFDSFRLNLIGTVKIDSIIDEHFARATITSGSVAKNNMVELSR